MSKNKSSWSQIRHRAYEYIVVLEGSSSYLCRRIDQLQRELNRTRAKQLLPADAGENSPQEVSA